MSDQFLFQSALTNKNHPIRVLTDRENDPWFVAYDVADVLQYKNKQLAIRKHVDEEDKVVVNEWRRKTSVPLALNLQDTTILINESGLYSLILRSKMKEAKIFKRFVTSQVLPSIRRNGRFTRTEFEESKAQFELQLEELRAENNAATLALEAANGALDDERTRHRKLNASYLKLERNHSRLLYRRDYYKFEKGNCFYIISDRWREAERFKFGVTEDINVRLASYRTSMPQTRVVMLVFVADNSLLESLFKRRMKSFIAERNHEYIENIVEEDVKIAVKKCLRFGRFDHKIMTEEELDKYNSVVAQAGRQMESDDSDSDC